MLKLSFLSLLLFSSFVSAEEERRADAHVHGLNNLSLIISNNQVAITYEMPIVQLLDKHDEHDEHDEHDDMNMMSMTNMTNMTNMMSMTNMTNMMSMMKCRYQRNL